MRKRARWVLLGLLVLGMAFSSGAFAEVGAAAPGKSVGDNDNLITPAIKVELRRSRTEALQKALRELDALSKKMKKGSGESSSVNVQVAFVVDTTGSMRDNIKNVADNLTDFARHLQSKGVSLKIAIVEYRDISVDGLDSTVVKDVDGSKWMEVKDCISTLYELGVDGGGDDPETPIDGLGYLLSGRDLAWEPSAYKFAVLLTDAGYKEDNRFGYFNLSVVARALAAKRIHTSVICERRDKPVYAPLLYTTGGVFGDIRTDFAEVLKQFADRILGAIEEETSENQVRVIGNAIGGISEKGYKGLSGSELLREEDVVRLTDVNWQGFAADGEARLLVRIQSTAPKTLLLSLTSDGASGLGIERETLDRGAVPSSFTLEKVGEKKYQKTIVLRAPESWPGAEDTSAISFDITVRNQDGTPFAAPRKLFLKKPPVVLVHGWRGTVTSFNENTERRFERGGFDWVHRGSYEERNVDGPRRIMTDGGRMFFYRFIHPAVTMALDKKYECVKVDVVAHSMGGLVAKAFAQSGYYRAPQSYGQGCIRRLVTLGTPHWGVGFFSYLQQDMDYLRDRFFEDTGPNGWRARSEHGLAWWGVVEHLQGGREGTAIEELAMYSPTITWLNAASYDIPMHCVAGDAGQSIMFKVGIRPYTYGHLYRDVWRDNGVILPDITEPSDGCVGLSSAQWGRSNVRFTTFNEWRNREHTELPNGPRVIARVVELLSGPKDAFRVPTPITWRPAYYTASSRAVSIEGLDRALSLDIPPEAISLTSDLLEVRPGRTVHLFAKAKTDGALDEVGFVPVGDGTAIDRDRYALDADGLGLRVRVPDDFSGVCEFGAVGLVSGEVSISNRLKIVSKPDLSGLKWLSFTQGAEASYLEGAKIPLQVNAYLRNGKRFDVSRHELGTTYASSNPSVGRISEDGRFEAVKAGQTTVTARNGTSEAVIDITVRSFNPAPTPTPPSTPPSAPIIPDPTPDSGSSQGSDGCNAGVSGLVLALAAAFLLKKKA